MPPFVNVSLEINQINPELRRKLFLRDYYKKKNRYTRSENDWQQHRKLRNAVSAENARTKNNYFKQKLAEANDDIKETWKISNSALGKRSKTTTIHNLEVNDNDALDHRKYQTRKTFIFATERKVF